MKRSELHKGKDEHEAARLAAIDLLGAVRPEVDQVLQELVDDVREAFETDLCMVNLVLSDVQYFRVWSGELPEDLAEARQDPRERSMCQYVVEAEAPLLVEDFLATEEFEDQYFCVDYGIRFYAGVPLITSDGYAIGSLCLINGRPKEISEQQMSLLAAFGRAVVGRIELLGALGREQTAREDEYRRSKDLQHVLNSSRDMIATVSADGVFKTMNTACAAILGYGPGELIGRSYMDLVYPDDRDLSAGLIFAIEDGETEVRFENRCLRKDGGIVWIEWSATSPREESVAYCVARDVTERKRAEEARRESEARYARIAANAPGMVFQFVLHPDGSSAFPFVSEGCCEIYDLEPQEIQRDPALIIDIIHPEDRPIFDQSVAASAASLSPWRWEGRATLPSGKQKWLQGASRPELQANGDILWDGLLMDITERKLTEEELLKNGALVALLQTVAVAANEAENVEEAIRYGLELIWAHTGWPVGHAYLVEDSLGEAVSTNIWHLDDPERFESFVEATEGTHLALGEGLPGRVLASGRADWIQEVTEDKNFPRARQADAVGIRSGFAFPVLVGREVVAVLEFFSTRPADPDEQLLEVTAQVGVQLGRVVERERAEEKMQRLNETLESRIAERTAQLEAVVAELRENANALRLRTRALDASSNGIVISDPNLPDNPIIYANPSFEHISGYATEEVLGKNCRFLQGADGDQPAVEELRAAIEAKRDSTVILRNYRKDGTLFWNELSISPVFDEEGRLINFIGVQNDATERKRAEEEIRELNETLEIRVVERTAQLQNAVTALEDAKGELEEARDAAEAANRAKSDFLANMSHEIRTPMNGVIGMTELLLDTGLDSEQREYAETVRRSGENLLVVINDILDFSKIEAGEVRLEKLSFDLRTTAEDVAHLLAERAQSKGLELISFVEPDMPPVVKGDPFRVRQVLTNLLGNAIKFTEEGEVVLRTSLAEENDGEFLIRFEVSDTGIGMTEDQQSRLFRSFSQADTSTTRKYGGTGLGLAISKQLVELMGGEIGVQSEPGQGSIFSFTVRLEKQPEEALAAPSTLANLRDLHVLIVDDNDTNRLLLRKQTSSWGMRNESVESGPRALEKLRSAAQSGDPYELAILDMQMPSMDGLQLARRIKADPAVSSTRLVLLTSMGQRADGEEARQSGIETYLTKPVRQSELYDCLATVMGMETTSLEDQQPVINSSLRESRAASNGHVLLAEDNPVNQKVAVLMLEKLGYKVDVASNGLEALEAFSRAPYDAVLMDVQMPAMDGHEATKEIRHRENERGSGRRLPIIAMTANAMKGDREKAIETGMDDYVSKPVKSEKLDEVLQRWIQRETPGLYLPTSENGSAKEDESVDPVDYRVVEGLRELQDEGGPDLLTELVDMFLSDVPPRLASLRDAVERGDAWTVERVAHALKGSCGNMGASRMAELCAELQEVGALGDLFRAPELLERTGAEFERVRPVLEAERVGKE